MEEYSWNFFSDIFLQVLTVVHHQVAQEDYDITIEMMLQFFVLERLQSSWTSQVGHPVLREPEDDDAQENEQDLRLILLSLELFLVENMIQMVS